MKSLINKYSVIILFSFMLLSISCKQQIAESIITNNEFNNINLDSFALAIKQQYQLPGLAIATIINSEIYDVAIVGKNKTQNGILLNDESKFQIASCTKSFTALLVSTFVEDRDLQWDTKISDVLQEMDIHEDYQDITIRQVLSHTAGLPQFWTDDEVFNIQEIIPDLQGSVYEKRKIFTQWNLKQQSPFDIGEHHYSNGGYVIISCLLEEISGKSFELLMKERIFKPLKLNSAEFGYPFIYDSTQPYRHMYRDEDGIGIPLNTHTRIADQIFNAAGFISLTISDFARYTAFYTKCLKGEDTVINSNIVKELFNPVIKLEDGNEIGMGWQIIYVNGIKTFGHTGSDMTMRSAMSINPLTGEAVVFTTNIGDTPSEMAMVNVIFKLLDL